MAKYIEQRYVEANRVGYDTGEWLEQAIEKEDIWPHPKLKDHYIVKTYNGFEFGTTGASPGDWIVRRNGITVVYTDKAFKEKYIPFV